SPPCNSYVLIMTNYEDDGLIIDALKAGADGYLSKRHTQAKELEAAIIEVMTGGGPMSPLVAHKVIASFQNHQREAALSRTSSAYSNLILTAREREVLKLVAQ